jgi:AAHS family 3-hydroxyphenylpropionic acid transporter
VLLWISSFLELLTLYLILSWLPLLLVGSGFTKAEAAGVQVAFNVGGGLAALGIGWLLESRARNPSIVAAFVSVPVFVLLLSHSPSQLAAVTLTVFGMGGSVLAAQSFLYATAPRCYPTLIRGVGLGAAVAVGRAGSIVGPKLGGALKAAGHGSGQLFTDIFPLVVLASVAGLWFAWQASRSKLA